MSTEANGQESAEPDGSAAEPPAEAVEVDIDYLRRIYASTREWYTVSETKAQLLLTANGAFVAIIFGALFGKVSDVRAAAARFGSDTWIFLGASVVSLVCAISCAALCLWSLHGRAGKEIAQLGVDRDDPSTYRPEVLWYFGHLANLRMDGAVQALRRADREFEVATLTYHVVELAQRVLRKHRWVNMGWAFTALALIALVAAGTSFFIRAQL